MVALRDLPVETLVDNVLPLCDARDILSITQANRFFAGLCADQMLWKTKCRDDFNFTGAGTARTTGWKLLYKGLRRPRIFVWGHNHTGRLGLQDTRFRFIAQPQEIIIPRVRIVSLVAGGWSFHALDSTGNMYVWGCLNPEDWHDGGGGFSSPRKQTPIPHKLLMPNPIRELSCGRRLAVALDGAGQVWTFLSWGRPFRLESSLLACNSPETTPQQIECSDYLATILMKSGDILVYWPFSITPEGVAEAWDQSVSAASDHSIPCATSTVPEDPILLPSIPALPPLQSLPDSGLVGVKEDTKVIKVAAFDYSVVALTNKGHVLKYDRLDSTQAYVRGRWEYLPKFSEVAQVAANEAYQKSEPQLEAPRTMRITHISAHYWKQFVAYSTDASSVVLLGDRNTDARTPPTIIPALQKRSIISVVFGDYHGGALNSSGTMMTWGARFDVSTDGQFGRGHEGEPIVDVSFDPDRNDTGNHFCYAATASGWHCGALIIDLGKEGRR